MVAAAALSGCDQAAAYHRDWQQCVDRNNVVVDDRYCDQNAQTGVHSTGPYFYHWWYSPRPYYRGETIFGGYGSPRAGLGVARASGISRGGFGASAHGGEGGGE